MSDGAKRQSDRIGVIGAGLGGLAAACTLAARGHKVILFDKNDWLGGKAAVLEGDGYRFDMGPTILTIPAVLKRIFDEAGRNMADYLDLVPLDPQWRCFFDDGTQLDLQADVAKMRAAIDRFTGDNRSGDGYGKFLNVSARLDEISNDVFFWKSVGGVFDTFDSSKMFDLANLKRCLELRLGRTVSGLVRQHIPDARVAQMVDHFVQYVGSAPDQSPAVLCSIAHMQTEQGVWYPMGGTAAVPKALTKLATELGVEIRYSTPIKQILVEGKTARGVVTEAGETIPLAAVVSNSDTVRMHRELLEPAVRKSFESRRTYEPACSGVVLYLGLKKRYEQLLHHCFVFSRDPHEEFDAIYRQGIPAPDPSAYLCAPAITEPGVAPPGGDALYVLVHTPYIHPGQDWTKLLPDYRQVILDKLKRTAGLTDLEENIVFERALTPADIERRYHTLQGAIYGLASHGRFFGAFKPANRSKEIRQLYFAGGTAHPGPGMPMVMMSGWIAADTLDKDRAGTRV
jgi:diapolycopene oxygenase